MNNLGLQRGTVQLLPYQESWATEFAAERARLAMVLGDRVLDIQHVGSTSVPGQVAKPIIDIAIAVASLDAVNELIAPLAQLGYDYKPDSGVPGRRFFAKGPESKQTHHLHLSKNDTVFRSLTQFRDRLIVDAEIAEQYSILKQDLASKFASDRASYTKGKNEFIAKVLRKSLS